jgi:hypothetical protein
MDKRDRQVYLITQVTCAVISALGMFVHDLWELKFGQGQIHTMESYEKLLGGLHHDAVIDYLRD